jgi:hypothetical protein
MSVKPVSNYLQRLMRETTMSYRAWVILLPWRLSLENM